MISQQKKRKMNPMLFNVLLISGGLHALALFVLGSITVYKYIIPDEAQFEEPPEIVEEQPPPDVKVEIKQQPPQQQKAMQGLKMKQVGNIAVNAVDVNLPSMQESFSVSAGLGNLGGSGALLGGTRGSIGIGMSDVSVFGLKTRAERILFLIDASRHMLTDQKGGLNSYQVIKDEITNMVGNLSAGTLFNVAFYDRRTIQFFRPQLIPAGEEITAQLLQWIQPINANPSSPGLSSGTVMRPSTLSEHEMYRNILHSGVRNNENATLTQVALEQQVDAIFIITGLHDGFAGVRRLPNDREAADWQRTIADRKYQEQLAEHQAEHPKMEQRIQNELQRINQERKKKSLPPRILSSQWGIYSRANELGLKWETEHPGFQPNYISRLRDVEQYFEEVVEQLYAEKGGEPPSVNVVLFLAGNEDLPKAREDRLDDYIRFFGGKYRIIRGLDEIKDAGSSKETKN
jgi:hypothetical protein